MFKGFWNKRAKRHAFVPTKRHRIALFCRGFVKRRNYNGGLNNTVHHIISPLASLENKSVAFPELKILSVTLISGLFTFEPFVGYRLK